MSELLELAERILEAATGSEEIEVYLSSGIDTEVQAYQGEIEQLSSATSSGVGIRVLRESVGGAQVGTAWAGSLGDEAIFDALREARDNVRFATEDEFLAFARPDGVPAVELELSDSRVLTTSIDDKIAMAIELERMVRSGDSRIRQVDSANYSDYVAEAAILSTTGIRATYARSGAFVSVEAIATDGDDDQTGWGLSAGRAPSDLDLAVAAADAISRATRMLGAVKPKSMKTTAVFDPRNAATLLSIIGGALSGEAVIRGRSFFANRLGETVASAQFTLLDDPTDPRHFAASVFDGEGLACRRNLMIEAGELRGFVYDTVSARRAGTVSTGSAIRGGIAGSPSAGCRALQLAPGGLSQDQIIASVGEGIYVESLMGIHSGVNPISGDFSVGVTGRIIRDGQLAEPVREVTVASTLQRMLLDVSHVGNDVEWLPGNSAGQTIAIGEIAVSGA
ncbi:MAG TPA: TldD/PmbA family protein [Acidimicrobiales bacterium]|nr:TldD/PmbA family protein [Acidimicrobiales bacterium]